MTAPLPVPPVIANEIFEPTLDEVGVPTIEIVPPEESALALPVMVAVPEALPDLVAVIVTVALVPSAIPLSVNGKLELLGDPGSTVPWLVVAKYV